MRVAGFAVARLFALASYRKTVLLLKRGSEGSGFFFAGNSAPKRKGGTVIVELVSGEEGSESLGKVYQIANHRFRSVPPQSREGGGCVYEHYREVNTQH
jgi:hypothetical protein